MAFCGFLRQSTAVDITLGPFMDEDDGKTAETALTLDVEVGKNGQALANKNEGTTPVHDNGASVKGTYNCQLDTTDTNTVGQLTVVAHPAGTALYVRQDYQVIYTAIWDALFANAANGFNASGRVDITAVNSVSWGTALGGVLLSYTGLSLKGTASAGGNNTITLAGGVAQDNYYNGQLVKIYGGTGIGQCRRITDYDGGTLIATVASNWIVNPDATSTYTVLSADIIEAALASICTEARLAELDAANLPTDVAAIPTTAMRGTDSAALASVCTEGRLAELDGANLPADIAAIPTTAMRGTDSAALAASYTATRAGYLDELAAANLPADIDAIKAVTGDMKVLDTTIASVDTADTVFRLTAGLTGNDDINNATCSIYDATGGKWSGPRRVSDYVHATLQVTIDANTAFPLAAGDRVVIWNVSYATTAAAGSITPGDIADIVDATWDEAQVDHDTVDTMGWKQNRSDRTGRQ